MSGFLIHLAVDQSMTTITPVVAAAAGFERHSSSVGMIFVRGPNAHVISEFEDVCLRHGEILSPGELKAIAGLSGPANFRWSHHRGTVLKASAHPLRVEVAADALASHPVYYWLSASGDQVVVSSSFSAVRQLAGTAIDEAGAYQYLTKGYTYGSRTVAVDVQQLRAAEVLRVLRVNNRFTASSTTLGTIWTSREPAPTSVVLDDLVGLWESECAKLTGSMLMMSGGWDSRTILGGVVASGINDNVLGYSHGSVDSREIGLAAEISRIAGIQYEQRSVEPQSFTCDAAETMIRMTDTFLFPHWWDAGAFSLTAGLRCVTAGIYGELLGGHSSVPFLVGGREGGIALARYLLGQLDPANANAQTARDRAVSVLDDNRYIRLWCMRQDWHARLSGWVHTATAEDVRDAIGRYADLGISQVERLVEAFVVDHRNRQYTNAQLRVAGHLAPVANPFTNPEILERVSVIPLTEKIHNDLNRRLLKRIAPELLTLPMAATLVPARYPVFVQEMSRVARKGIEMVTAKAARMTGGRIPNPQLSWVDFEFLRSDNSLHELVESLRLDIWDKPRMHAALANGPANIHSTFDMLAKCKTLDFHMTGTTDIPV